MSYKEFEIDVIGRDGEKFPMTFNLSNISYYRPFVENTSEIGNKDKIVTMVYLVGSVKATRVQCSYDDFKRKIKEVQSN